MTSAVPVPALRVMIADDEPPARRRLRALLSAHPAVELVGEAQDGGEAVELVQQCRPQLVLLDVQMPVATGFEVIDAIGVEQMPAVVFVTAFDRYALRAFDVHALDYLLKPVDPERLALALRRAGARAGSTGPASALQAAMAELRQTPVLRRIPVRHGGRIRFVEVADVDYVLAEGNYVRLRGTGTNYLLRETLGSLEGKLRPHGFVRIHRGTLVQRDRIVELEPLFHGEYAVRLRDGTKLTSGRTYRESLRSALELARED